MTARGVHSAESVRDLRLGPSQASQSAPLAEEGRVAATFGHVTSERFKMPGPVRAEDPRMNHGHLGGALLDHRRRAFEMLTRDREVPKIAVNLEVVFTSPTSREHAAQKDMQATAGRRNLGV